MSSRSFKIGIWASIALASLSHAHMGAFHEAMYCVNGTDPNSVDYNNDKPVQPLYNLTFDQAWMHAVNGCNKFPPSPGVFLELPAGGTFTVEIAANRRCTTLDGDAGVVTAWGDCRDHPDDYHAEGDNCISSPNLHAKNQATAAGTAFAISYESDIDKVTLDNLVVFTVRYHTPWKRVTTYDVPSGMPACPEEGCICTWVWIPDGCGTPNMYMFPYRCKVNPDATSPKTIGTPKPPVWCEDDPSKCVEGAKQIMIWNQLEGNNIHVEGYDLSGKLKSPGYNWKCGFNDGAQNDIFVASGTGETDVQSSGTSAPAATSTSAPTSASAPSSSAPSSPSSTPSNSGTTSTPSTAQGVCTSTGSNLRTRGRHAKTRRERHNVF